MLDTLKKKCFYMHSLVTKELIITYLCVILKGVWYIKHNLLSYFHIILKQIVTVIILMEID